MIKFFPLLLKNLWRSKLRSILTTLAIVLLAAIFTMIWTVVGFLDSTMTERTKDVPVIMTQRYRIPSQFDRMWVDKVAGKGDPLNAELSQVSGFHPEKHNLWHFIVFSLDPDLKDQNQVFFCIACIPEKIGAMTDELEDFDKDLKYANLMKNPPRSKLRNIGILLGPERLEKIHKKVGDVFKAKSFSHRDGGGKYLEMDFEVVGELPANGRWAGGGFMDYEYLDRILKASKSDRDGTVNIAWLIVDDQKSVTGVGNVFEDPKYREIKAESAATATSRFMESFKDLLAGIKWVLRPVIVIVMIVIVAVAISITVRERTTEIAVLKVLGFGKGLILALILGEGLLLGALGGLLGSAGTYVFINHVVGGIRIPFGWFPAFYVPLHALWWGPVLGVLTAFVGGVIPSCVACYVKVSQVFARVT
jgi:putative ABC transport system permease protein